MTVMVYTDMNFNFETLFKKMKITEIEVPYTKKQKNVDKKRLWAPDGSIIALQFDSKIRGVDTRKKKKIWCTVCRPVEIVGDREVKINTVSEVTEHRKNSGYPKETLFLKYFCSRCNKLYEVKEIKKINYFLNQITMILSLGHILLNIMMFKDNLKIAGCKSLDDAKEAVLCLWQEFISVTPNSFSFMPTYDHPSFTFDIVMRNVDFPIGFPIERKILNEIMNDPKYSEHIFMSQYENTGITNVNIKMYSLPKDIPPFDRMVIPKLKGSKSKRYGDPYLDTTTIQRYGGAKDKNKKAYITFIVFSSSETILSGKYEECMRDSYNFFMEIIAKNRVELSEKIKKIDPQQVKNLMSTWMIDS